MGKDSDKDKPEAIGGLADSGAIDVKGAVEDAKSDPPPPPVPPPPPAETPSSTLGGGGEAEKKPEGDSGGGALSGLDLFSEESMDDVEENKLAASLPEIDINDLLSECKEIAEALVVEDPE